MQISPFQMTKVLPKFQNAIFKRDSLNMGAMSYVLMTMNQ